MEVVRLDDAATFLAEAEPLLLADEARHNLILGIAGTLRDHPSRFPEYALWLAEEGSATVGAALRTPPYKLVLARPREDSALEALAAAIDDELPGVVAALPEVETFAAAWAAKTGAVPRKARAEARGGGWSRSVPAIPRIRLWRASSARSSGDAASRKAAGSSRRRTFTRGS